MGKFRLISMTDFVLEQGKTVENQISNEAWIDVILGYATFLKQPLTLGMFVPTDEDGIVLEEPIYTIGGVEQYAENYQQAKERVLFESVSLQHAKWLIDTFTLIEDITSIQSSMTPIYLTPQALKQIGI